MECRTAAKACELVLGDRDTDLAEYLVSRKPTAEQVEAWLCQAAGEGACTKAPPPLPADRPKGAAFKALTEDELHLRRTTRSMEQQGIVPGE